jgi:hypothetical protein
MFISLMALLLLFSTGSLTLVDGYPMIMEIPESSERVRCVYLFRSSSFAVKQTMRETQPIPMQLIA